jgi:membrane associated rhomboid family serine protease
MLLVGYLAGRAAFGYDWLDAGALLTGATRAGEFWRAVTALTLHLDVGHLLANLGFGTVFGLLAGQLLGPGVAWASVLAAAATANLLNAFIQPVTHSSVGASTAVFATLGLLSAYAWRKRAGQGDRWAYRWAPLVAGVILLGFTGAGGERTDVLAPDRLRDGHDRRHRARNLEATAWTGGAGGHSAGRSGVSGACRWRSAR